ncbi:MAG TPA: adenylate kinase [Planctomycetota bacterium]|nr:adenylate kinase [Planctomycetota bacterium]
MATVLILLGPPGAGKGTQAARLSARMGLRHISTGDLFRDHLERKSDLGEKARGYMERGELVPDGLVLDMLRERVSQLDCRDGFVLDGFPRTVPQAEALETLLGDQGVAARALSLEVDDEVLVARLTGRRVCKRDGSHIQHVLYSPPATAGVCDTCAGELYQRKDDSEDVVGRRLEVYREQTAPLLDFYEQRGILESIDGDRPPEVVLADIARWAQGAA